MTSTVRSADRGTRRMERRRDGVRRRRPRSCCLRSATLPAPLDPPPALAAALPATANPDVLRARLRGDDLHPIDGTLAAHDGPVFHGAAGDERHEKKDGGHDDERALHGILLWQWAEPAGGARLERRGRSSAPGGAAHAAPTPSGPSLLAFPVGGSSQRARSGATRVTGARPRRLLTAPPDGRQARAPVADG